MNPRTLAVLSLLLLPLAWLWPCVLGERAFVPYDVDQFPPASVTADAAELQQRRAGANLDVTEVPIWFLPELEFAGDELAAGRLPTWNPNARHGAPLHAHGLIGLCYPPNWLALFAAEPRTRLHWLAWCNLAIAGLLTFGLLRRLGYGLLPAWVGAALFELSTPLAANAFFWMRLASMVWLPGVLWAMAAIADGDRLRARTLAALGGCFAMSWLGGFPPYAASTSVFAGAFFVWLVGERARARGARPALRLGLALATGLALGACLALPQVLPSLLFFPHSARPPVPSWSDVSGQAFEPYGLLCYLAPDAFGHPSDRAVAYGQGAMQLLLNTRTLADGKAALPNYNYTEYALSVSTLGFVLAGIGLFCARGRRTGFARTAWLGAAALALFLPGVQWLFHLPVIQNVWPFRWLGAATPLLAWLAAAGAERLLAAGRILPAAAAAGAIAFGSALWAGSAVPAAHHRQDRDWAVDALAEHYDSDRKGVLDHVQGAAEADRFALAFERFAAAGRSGGIWLLLAGGLLGAMAPSRRRPPLLFVGALAALVQLGTHGATLTHGTTAAAPTATPIHTFLRQRLAATPGGFTFVRGAQRAVPPMFFAPGQVTAPGARDLNYYSHADRRTLQPLQRLVDRYHEALGLEEHAGRRIAGKGYLTAAVPAPLLQHPWFDLMNVRYVLAVQPLDGIGPEVGPAWAGRGAFHVYERKRALPRAYTVAQVTPLADDEAVLAALTDESLQPRAQAFARRDELPDGFVTAGAKGARAVTFVRDEATTVELDVAAGRDRFLVLADTFLPGWTATVADRPAPIVRANHSQRLVALPDRECRVVFRYRAPGLLAGSWVAAIATLLLIATALLLRRRRTRFDRAATQDSPS